MAAILEFGPYALFRQTHGDATLRLWTGERDGDGRGEAREGFGWRSLAVLHRLLSRHPGALVACHVPIARLHPLGPRAAAYRLLLRHRGPLLGLDFNDARRLTPTALAVLERCDLYFKRELPLDRGALLASGAAAKQARLARQLHKLRPVSLGLAPWRIADLPERPPEKSSDLFFAGTLSPHNRVRRQGAALLQRLAAEGYRIDHAPGRLERPEYLRRCAAAWLVWSPEGKGWQCFRPFEAAAAGSVPLVNAGTVEMPHPLLPGEHCLHYDAGEEGDGEDLLRVAREALADRERLLRMAAAARTHVLAHHLHRTVAEGILEGFRAFGTRRGGSEWQSAKADDESPK